jgi:hypothetical protein
MTLVQILDCLGVPLVFGEPPLAAKPLGDPDASFAGVHEMDGVVGVWSERTPAHWGAFDIDGVLHEAVHAVAGTSSFEDEGGAVVLQWLLIQEMDPEEQRWAREEFGNYALLSGDIGDDNDFLSTEEWRLLVTQAVDQGLVVRRGSDLHPVWGLGIHPSFANSSTPEVIR